MKALLRKNLATAACLSSLLLATPAFAVDYVLTFGVAQQLTLMTGDRILVDAGGNRSYTCEGVPLDIMTDFDFSTMIEGTSMDDPQTVTAREGGMIVPGVGGEADDRANNRVIFTPMVGDRYAITVASANGGGENVLVRCFATTLFGGFNTNVNDFNFLELTNIGNVEIEAKVTAVTFDGTVALDNQTVTIPAGQRVDVSIHDTAGADKYGIIRVTHNAPLGTLQANVSQYFGTVEEFRLGGTSPLVPFTQNQ